MITVLLLLLAAHIAPADAKTCPGGPLFGFVRGSDRLDMNTDSALNTYIENINVPLWRSGWITVTPVVSGRVDGLALQLADRRRMMIARRLRDLGVKADRIRFAAVRPALPGEADADVYPSTLSTTQALWDAYVTPGIVC